MLWWQGLCLKLNRGPHCLGGFEWQKQFEVSCCLDLNKVKPDQQVNPLPSVPESNIEERRDICTRHEGVNRSRIPFSVRRIRDRIPNSTLVFPDDTTCYRGALYKCTGLIFLNFPG